MKKFKLLAVLSLPFLLMSCNSGNSGGSSNKGEEVDFKTFVTKLADSVEKNEFFIKDGVKSDKEFKANGNISYLNKASISGKEETIDDIKASASGSAQLDLDNDIAKADFKYKVSLIDASQNKTLDGTFSGQLQGDNGKLYAIDLTNNKSTIVNGTFTKFKDYLNNIPSSLEKTSNWKETYVSSIIKTYDDLMAENAEFKKAMESGILKYYVSDESYTMKLSGEASFEYPAKYYEVSTNSETGETKTTEKIAYKLAINVSGGYTIKLDLTNGKESLAMNGKLALNVTVKDAVEDNKLQLSSIATSLINRLNGTSVDPKYYQLGSNDSLNLEVNAKLNASLKDTNVTLSKVSI